MQYYVDYVDRKRHHAQVWWAKALFFPIRRRIKKKKKKTSCLAMGNKEERLNGREKGGQKKTYIHVFFAHLVVFTYIHETSVAARRKIIVRTNFTRTTFARICIACRQQRAAVFWKKNQRRQPWDRRISGKYSSLLAALLVLVIYYVGDFFYYGRRSYCFVQKQTHIRVYRLHIFYLVLLLFSD